MYTVLTKNSETNDCLKNLLTKCKEGTYTKRASVISFGLYFVSVFFIDHIFFFCAETPLSQ